MQCCTRDDGPRNEMAILWQLTSGDSSAGELGHQLAISLQFDVPDGSVYSHLFRPNMLKSMMMVIVAGKGKKKKVFGNRWSFFSSENLLDTLCGRKSGREEQAINHEHFCVSCFPSSSNTSSSSTSPKTPSMAHLFSPFGQNSDYYSRCDA